jgi:hypothetical protein
MRLSHAGPCIAASSYASRTNARAAFYVKWTIHLKSTAIHHLLYMVLWVFSFIHEWRVTPILHQKGDLIWCTLFKDSTLI